MIIGVDPHKSSHTATAVDPATNTAVASLRVDASLAGYRQLLRWSAQFEDRCWAIENARGLGRHLAQWLVGRDEVVLDVERGGGTIPDPTGVFDRCGTPNVVQRIVVDIVRGPRNTTFDSCRFAACVGRDVQNAMDDIVRDLRVVRILHIDTAHVAAACITKRSVYEVVDDGI